MSLAFGGAKSSIHIKMLLADYEGITFPISHDKCDKNKCLLLFAEEIASDTTTQHVGLDNPVRIFPDSKSNMRLFQVGHADFKNPYETEIIGVNLQCGLGLVDVFLQDTCVGSANYCRSYKECVRMEIDNPVNGTKRCTYRCYPIYNSNTTFVRFAQVKYITADYSAWTLNAILTATSIDDHVTLRACIEAKASLVILGLCFKTHYPKWVSNVCGRVSDKGGCHNSCVSKPHSTK